MKEIDREHRGLLTSVIESSNPSKKKMNANNICYYDSLIHYACSHCAAEERCMMEAEYPETFWYIGLHYNFTRKVFLLSEEY